MIREELPHHISLYILGWVAMSLAVGFIIFCIYVIPNLFWGLQYNVPAFVTVLSDWYAEHQSFAAAMRILGALLPFVLAAFVFAFIARRIERLFSDETEGKEVQLTITAAPEEVAEARDVWETFKPAILVLLLLVAVLVLLYVIEVWFLNIVGS